MADKNSYYRATLHPWPCFVFFLPLLGLYEFGIYLIGGPRSHVLRNGADAWLRWALDVYGVKPFLAAPAIIVAVFAFWSFRRWNDRPDHTWSTIAGMWFESVVYAFGLWALGHNFAPILRSAGIALATAEFAVPTDAMAKVITFVGAGIYEELLFRLFIITGLAALLKCGQVPPWASLLLAGLGSALLFAAAHHIGAQGEPLDAFRFLYRTTAGVYFALIFWFRGFGIAVGTHALYDVLVGVRIA